MASLAEKLELILNVNTQGAVAQLESFAKSSEKATTSASDSLKKYQAAAKTALSVGVAGVGVGGLLTQLASGDIEAANQLKAAIQQVGQSYSEFEDRIDKAADSQVKFGHTDEEVKGALTTLTLAYNDTNKALDEMQLVADLAARKHISLGEAATIVAKAHGGAGRVFKEFGIVVKDNIDGTKNYDGALAELAGKLKGQASASADTFAGRLSALRAEAENAVSEFGQKFGPAILGVSAAMTVVGSATSAVTALLTRRAESQAAAAAAAEADAAALGTEAAAEGAVATGATGAIASLGLLAAAVGVTALAFKVGKDYLDDWNGGGVSAVTAVDKAISRLSNSHDLKNFNMDVLDTLGALQEGGNGIDGFADAAKRLFDETLKQKGKDAANDLLGSLTELQSQGFIPTTVDIGGMQSALNTFAEGHPLEQTAADLKALQDEVKNVTQQYEDAAQARRGLLSADVRVASGLDNIADANARVAEAKAKLGTGTTAEENAKLQRDYNDAVRGAETAVSDYAEAQTELAEQIDKASGAQFDQSHYSDIYAENLHNYAQDLTTGDVKQALDKHIADLDTTTEAYKRLAQAAADAQLAERAAAGDTQAQNTLAERAQRDSGNQQRIGAYATGGDFGAGYRVVGDKGPELEWTAPGGYGHVWNAGETDRLLRGFQAQPEPPQPVVHQVFTMPGAADMAEQAFRGARRALVLSRR